MVFVGKGFLNVNIQCLYKISFQFCCSVIFLSLVTERCFWNEIFKMSTSGTCT